MNANSLHSSSDTENAVGKSLACLFFGSILYGCELSYRGFNAGAYCVNILYTQHTFMLKQDSFVFRILPKHIKSNAKASSTRTNAKRMRNFICINKASDNLHSLACICGCTHDYYTDLAICRLYSYDFSIKA